MNTPSVFQIKHPLSPRKFWKKVISRLPAMLGWSLLIGGFSSFLYLRNAASGDVTVPAASMLVLIGAIAAAFVVIYGLYAWYVTAYIRLYFYDASDKFLTIKKGVFAPTEIHVPYAKIQDVYVDQDILDRVLGIYDVHIASATVTSGIEAHIDGVAPDVAESLKNLLLNSIQFGSPTANAATDVAASAAAASPVVNAPAPVPSAVGVFNSRNYPIDGRWLVSMLLINVPIAVVVGIFSRGFFMDEQSGVSYVSLNGAIFIGFAYYVLYTIWSVLWIKAFSFEFQPQFILLKTGVISREEKHVPYRSLQNVLLKRNLIARLLGLSAVVIENAAVQNVGKRGGARASAIIIPGQPLVQGEALVAELNRIMSQATPNTGTGL